MHHIQGDTRACGGHTSVSGAGGCCSSRLWSESHEHKKKRTRKTEAKRQSGETREGRGLEKERETKRKKQLTPALPRGRKLSS